MKEQCIIAIGREYASGGHNIAEQIAKHYGLPLYDKNMLAEIEKMKGMDLSAYNNVDEKKKNIFLSRTVKGFSNSPEAALAYMQFDFLLSKAASGESFVVCGRCAEYLFKGNPHLISAFILADEDRKVERIMALHQLTENEARHEIQKLNRQRKEYHNQYCEGKWGDARNYDITVNSSRLGIDKTAKFLIDYIDRRMV